MESADPFYRVKIDHGGFFMTVSFQMEKYHV